MDGVRAVQLRQCEECWGCEQWDGAAREANPEAFWRQCTHTLEIWERKKEVCLMIFEICPAYIEEFTIGKAYTRIATEAIPAWTQLTPCPCVTRGMLAEPCSCWCTTTKNQLELHFSMSCPRSQGVSGL